MSLVGCDDRLGPVAEVARLRDLQGEGASVRKRDLWVGVRGDGGVAVGAVHPVGMVSARLECLLVDTETQLLARGEGQGVRVVVVTAETTLGVPARIDLI